ncbi:MAG: hypothetical protein NTV51_13820 [Verrucomicrobia bacterium]|nr:hypothetical protein [Verrucomicrobiota bacterium]
MSLPKVLLAASGAANLACAVALAFRPSLAPPAVRDFLHLHDTTAEARLAAETRQREAAAAKTSAAQAAARRALLWSALDSADLKTLVAHLRAAGFSPIHIRAVVSARIEARFAARRQEIAGTVTDTPYWKPEPLGWNNNARFYEEMNQLFRERAAALRDVLGDDFFAESAAEATAEQRRRFGDLPTAKIALVQRVEDDYAEMISQIRAGMQGITLPEDREKLALLEREKRADLAALLSPEELRDYEIRTSTIATRLRPALTVMDATEAEFRAIYALQEPLADRLYPVGGVKGAAMSRARKEAEEIVANQLATVLGPARAADFVRASSSDYQDLYRLAQRENLPSDAAARAFDLRNATAAEARRIAADKALGDDERRAAVQALAQTAKVGLIAALGPKAGDTYLKSADWLRHIEGGGTVSFNNNGGTMFYSLPKPATPGK